MFVKGWFTGLGGVAERECRGIWGAVTRVEMMQQLTNKCRYGISHLGKMMQTPQK